MSHNKVLFILIMVCWVCSMGESGVVAPKKPLRSHIAGKYKDFQMKTNVSELDCSQFIDDYDVLRQLPFQITIKRFGDNEFKTDIAIMDKDNTSVKLLSIEKKSVVPLSLFCLSNLETLAITWTPFENDTVPDALANLKNLQNFWFYNAPIVKITEKLETLTNLSALIFNNCSLTQLPKLNHRLWTLSLPKNRLSHLDEIPGVKSLNLAGNFFKQIPITTKQENLVNFDMSNNPLENALPIMSYKNLGAINLRNTTLTTIPPDIDQLQRIKELDLSNNKLSHLPANILNLPQLENFDISGNLLSSDDIQSIRQAFKKSRPETYLVI